MIEGRLTAEGKCIVVVAARWNELVTKQLADGAIRALRSHGLESPELVWVPGTWELPIAAAAAIERGAEALVCVGCILQGATIHAAQLSNQVAASLADISGRTGVPITWGVLTC